MEIPYKTNKLGLDLENCTTVLELLFIGSDAEFLRAVKDTNCELLIAIWLVTLCANFS